MKRFVAGTLLVLFLSAGWVHAADGKAARLNRKANDLYQEGKNEEALEHYAEALARDPESRPLNYNMGNALFRLGRLDEALAAYGAVAEQARPETELGRAARFNEGTASLQAEDFAAAVNSLRQAVMANPADGDARHNLELALARLQQQEQQQEQQQSGDPGDEESESDEQNQEGDADETEQDQEQEGGPQDKQQEQQPDPDGEPPPNPRGDEDEGPPESPPDSQPELAEQQQDLSEEEARRLLASLARDERQELKESLEKPQPRGKRGGRDW